MNGFFNSMKKSWKEVKHSIVIPGVLEDQFFKYAPAKIPRQTRLMDTKNV